MVATKAQGGAKEHREAKLTKKATKRHQSEPERDPIRMTTQ